MKNKKHPWKMPFDVNRAIEKQLVSGYQFPVLDDLSDLPGVMTDEQIIAPLEALVAQTRKEECAEESF